MQCEPLKLMFRPVLIIVLLGLVLNLGGTWMFPLIDRDEPRFAEASREMLARHDWVVPWFAGIPRYDKPPLIYWTEIICYRVFGENDFATRLPSVGFASGSALLIFLWGRRWTKPATALAAGIIFITCLQAAIHGRLAVADMAMVFFVCAAFWSGWELTRPELPFRWRWWCIFHVSLALGFLAKGPVAWLPIVGLIVGWRLRPQQFVFYLGRFIWGLLLTLAIVGTWGIPALIETHGDFLYVGLGYHVIYRSFGVLDGHGAHGVIGWAFTAPFFLAAFFISFFPWAFYVPRALGKWWPARESDVLGWYLLVQAAIIFLVFTVVRTKLLHYTLPAFPCLALWLAKASEDGLVPGLRIFKTALFMSVFILVVCVGLGQSLGPLFVAHNLFAKASPFLRPQMTVAAVDYTEPSLVWEFRGVVSNNMEFIDRKNVGSFLRQTNALVLVMPTHYYETNLALHASNCTVVQARGINFARFDKVELTAVIRH